MLNKIIANKNRINATYTKELKQENQATFQANSFRDFLVALDKTRLTYVQINEYDNDIVELIFLNSDSDLFEPNITNEILESFVVIKDYNYNLISDLLEQFTYIKHR